jgi:hypothetical protein
MTMIHPGLAFRTRAHAVLHYPATRMLLFLGAVILSVWLADRVSHSPLVTTGAAAASLSLSKGLERLAEVLCDCVCDRLFPQ